MTDTPSSRSPAPAAPDPPDVQPAPLAKDDSSAPSHAAHTLSSKRDTSAPQNPRALPYSRNQTQPAGIASGLQSLGVSRSPSIGASPRSSRDSSPAGPSFRQPSSSATNTANTSRGMRSRKNSHDVSPQRPGSTTSTVPSAAAIQRALSSTAAPQLQPTASSEQSSRLPRSQKSNGTAEGPREGLSWPTSPRLKSPPPASSNSRRNSLRNPRKPESNGAAPNIVVQPITTEQSPERFHKETENLTPKGNSGPRVASNAPVLETVQESSAPVTPQGDESSLQSSEERKREYFSFASEDERPLTALQDTPKASSSMSSSGRVEESGSDSGGQKSRITSDPDATPRPKSSLTNLKPKSGVEPALENMTVETETVSSIPQAPLGPPSDRNASGRSDAGIAIRVKASKETIRPRKERKKMARKAPSLNTASSSTRADIFEDRVKNAMDEATSDDSDETFVYESNPPDAQPRRSRHHSRTPSGASVASTAERGVVRSIANALDPQRAVPKTRSMKFASNTSNYGTGDEEVEGLNGTVRARDRNGTSSIHHHHLGRQNRPAAGQPSILDDDNPLFPLSKTRSLTAVGGRGSHAARIAAQQLRNPSGVKRSDGYVSYDLEAEGADDERTPLTGTVRTPRSAARSSRLARYRYNDLRSQPPQRNFLTRFAGCLLILVTVCLLTFGVVCFLFAMSKPLMNVAIVDIKGVIASEQEIMMDLVVQATNPNLVPISVTDLDVNLFARSKYVGSEKWWREHGSIPKDEHDTDGDKDRLLAQVSERRGLMTDRRALTPILPGGPNLIIVDPDIPRSKDPSAGQTMLLGHVVHFDNPLSFDGSFWKREPYFSTGSLRLSKPGNHTEAGGTERWERVLTHDFDLIVRGVIRYGIPLGGRTVSVPVSGESPVKGNGGKDDGKDPGDGDGDDDDDDGDW